VCLRATAATEKVEQELLDFSIRPSATHFSRRSRFYAFEEFADAPEFTRRLRK